MMIPVDEKRTVFPMKMKLQGESFKYILYKQEF